MTREQERKAREAANRELERRISESEGDYERFMVAQALRAAARVRVQKAADGGNRRGETEKRVAGSVERL